MLNPSFVRRGLRGMCWVAACVLVSLVFPAKAQGGAWDDRPGRGELIMTASMLRSWDEYGPNGARVPFGYAGRFRQIEFGDYIEIGMPHRFTLVLNLPAAALEYQDQFHKQQSGGLGDMEVGLRRRLNRTNSAWALSGQLTVTAPLYSASVDPAPGNHQEDVEGRFLAGHGAEWDERHWFWDAEAAYRYRTGAPADQLRGDLTGGVEAVRRCMLLGQFYSIKGLRNGQPLTANSNPNAQSDFDLYKAQGSLVVRVLHKTRVQMGWGHTLAGRNTGRGGGYVLGLWQSF
jgi:hypothetical protein